MCRTALHPRINNFVERFPPKFTFSIARMETLKRRSVRHRRWQVSHACLICWSVSRVLGFLSWERRSSRRLRSDSLLGWENWRCILNISDFMNGAWELFAQSKYKWPFLRETWLKSCKDRRQRRFRNPSKTILYLSMKYKRRRKQTSACTMSNVSVINQLLGIDIRMCIAPKDCFRSLQTDSGYSLRLFWT